MSNKHLLRVSAAAFSIVLLAGCGSSPKSAPAAAGSQTTSSKSPTAAPKASPASASPASVSQLKKIVLQPAELPKGSKGTPHKSDPSEAVSQAAVVKCLGARNTDGDKIAEANSADFALGTAGVSSSAASYKTQSAVDADVAMLRSPKLSTCYEQLVRKQLARSLPAGAKVESASVKITPGSGGGPASIVATATGTITVSVNGQRAPVYVRIAFITGRLMESDVSFFSFGTPIQASAVKSMVNAVATRAAKA